MPKKITDREMTASEFIALPDAQKERIFQDLENQTPQERRKLSKPLSAAEKADWRKFQQKARMGRPRLGPQGTENISVSIEKSLLAAADAFARKQHLNRSQMVSQALRKMVAA